MFDRVARAFWVRGVEARHRTGGETAVEAPVEAYPRGVLHRHLILEVSGLVVAFVVVDTERKSTLSYRSAGSSALRREEASSNRRHNDEGREVVIVGDIHAKREAGNLRVVPVDGEGNRSIAEYAEVKGVVGVLPDVVATEDEIFAEGLLETSVKLVAIAGLESSRYARAAEKQWSKDFVGASLTGQNEVLIEG